MSCGNKHDTPCSDVLNSVVLVIDGEIDEISRLHEIEVHLDECPPCKAEMEHERRMHALLHEILSRACCEKAPQDLRDQIAAQIGAMKGAGSDFVTEYRMTEISIQIDEFGQIEHREVTIESTQEFRLPNQQE